MNFLEFNPHKPFLHQPILWFTVFIFFSVSMLFSIIIITNSDMYFCWSGDCFNYFVEVFKVPLGILALIIPIVALLATNHRTVQTIEQIRVAESQNLFANYIRHKEDFLRHSSQISSFKIVETANMIETYKILFPNAKSGDYMVDSQNLQNTEEVIKIIYNKLKKINESTLEKIKVRESLFWIFFLSTNILWNLKLDFCWEGKDRQFEEISPALFTIPDSSYKIQILLNNIARTLKILFEFSIKPVPTPMVDKLIKFQFEYYGNKNLEGIFEN